MNIVRWNPFGELEQAFVSEGAFNWQPLADVRETKDGYRVELELPAVEREDMRIELRERTLHVSGERRFAEDKEDGRVHRRERRYGKFTRSFRLPADADPSAVRATAKDGVVTINVAKRASAQPRAIEVEAA